MEEVNYRTVLMDRTDLRSALEQIERGLNELRDVMVGDRGHCPCLVEVAADIERIAAHARETLATTGTPSS